MSRREPHRQPAASAGAIPAARKGPAPRDPTGAAARVRRTPALALAGRNAGRRQRGYSLIEVIVAFALLALALTLLLGTLSGATRQVRWSGDAGRAALHAQSLLDQVGVGEPLRAGQSAGDFDDGRYRWTLQVAPWTDPALPPAATIDPAAARLYGVTLSVQWGDGRPGEQLKLRTLKLAAPGIEAALP